jgi:hypothetical protein
VEQFRNSENFAQLGMLLRFFFLEGHELVAKKGLKDARILDYFHFVTFLIPSNVQFLEMALS